MIHHRLRGAGGERDPYFSSVSLLLHFDGTDGSTTITDSSPSPKTIAVNGDAQIDTAQSKFGGSSMYFDVNGGYLSVASSSGLGFGTGDFTIEMFYYPVTRPNDYPFILANKVSWETDAWQLADRHAGRNTKFTLWSYNIGSPLLVSTTDASNNTWYHIAICRSGNNFYMFINGVLESTATSSNSLGASSDALLIGGINESYNYTNSYIDELRITKGIARYTADFTPPPAPFPNR